MIGYDQGSVLINNNTKKSSTVVDDVEWLFEETASTADTMTFDSTTHLINEIGSDDDDVESPSPAEQFRTTSAHSSSTSASSTPATYSWQGTFVTSLLLVLVVCLGLFLGRTYVKAVLVWLEYQNEAVAVLLFVLLFTLVSFPFMWGYILLNVVCGYLYGFLFGLLIVMFAVVVGTTVAHLVMRRCLHRVVATKLEFNGLLKATLMVLGGPQTFKVVAITRLTPIPFGLQNALFAISPISTGMYLMASMLGLLPTQAINAYLGSTLRTMEDVLSDANTATTGYIVLAVQVVISIGLTAYVVHKAKVLLRQVMSEAGGGDIATLTDINANGPTSLGP